MKKANFKCHCEPANWRVKQSHRLCKKIASSAIGGLLAMTIGIAFFISPAQAVAEETVNIKLQVKTFDAILYDSVIDVTACENAPSSTVFTFNAWCALTQAANQNGWTISSTWGAWGVFLQAINQYNGADNNWWLWYSNSEPGATALNMHELTSGETLLLTYGTNPLKISVNNVSPLINTTSTITAMYFDPINWNWTAAIDVNFIVNGLTDDVSKADGIYSLWTNTTSAYTISAKKTGYLESNIISISAQLPSTSAKLRIETASGTIFNQTLNVTACESSPGSGLFTINGKCAVDQSGVSSNWSWWGDDAFLNSINEYANDFINNIYWGWFGNLEYGQTALNKHVLSADEKLLLVYNTNPLKIIASATGTLNTTSTITLQQFGLDASWNPVWMPATSGTIVINGENFETTDGTYKLFLATTTPYTVYGKKTGYLDSEPFTITALEQTQNDNDQPCRGCGAPPPPTYNNLDTNKAVNFLISQQNADGSFSSALYSDWAAVAFGAYGETPAKEKIKQYLQTDPSPIAGLNEMSDYARRAMALMSLGINPYNGTATDYIKKLTDRFDGAQFGDDNLYNDDIFALFPLLKAGYVNTDAIIASATQFILSKQGANGDWGSTDLTAAAIQALTLVKNIDGVNVALTKAKNFLVAQQQTDGGWGNTFSTSWAMQAIASLGENQTLWVKNNKTPGDYLFLMQASDGGMDVTAPTSSRVWATTYVVPAALSKPWPQIMNSFAKPVEQNLNSGTNSNTSYTTPIATSTLPIATTTEKITEKENKPIEKEPATLLPTENAPLLAPAKPTAQNSFIKKESTYESTNTESLTANTAPSAALANIAAELPLPRRARTAAKAVAVVSASGAGALGLYLGFKLLKNML